MPAGGVCLRDNFVGKAYTGLGVAFLSAARWWKPALLPTYKVSTRLQAEQTLKNYLIPRFGDFRLSDIKKPDVQVFLGGLLDKLAPDTVHGIRRYLGRIFSCAVEWGYISDNPARGIRLPPTRRREPPFITPEQFRQLIEALPQKVQLMVLLAMMTSMHVGEILGLRWSRVDFDSGVIRVTERFYRGDFSTVKSRRSDRIVPLTPIVEKALKLWKNRKKNSPDDLVFSTRNGKPLSDGNLLKRIIYPACDALKIPRLSWHLFRHMHGTLLAQLGVHVSVAQAQLGHADPRITLMIYTHVMPGAQREAVERLESFLMFPSVPKLPVSGAIEVSAKTL